MNDGAGDEVFERGERAIHRAASEFTQFLVLDTPPCQYCRIHSSYTSYSSLILSDTQDPLILPGSGTIKLHCWLKTRSARVLIHVHSEERLHTNWGNRGLTRTSPMI